MSRKMLVVLALVIGLAPAPAQGRSTLIGADSWRAGEVVEVSVDGRDYALRLADNPLLRSGAADSLAAIRTLGGDVAGHPGSWVRVTAAPGFLSGLVRVDGRTLEITRSGVVPVRGDGLSGRIIDFESTDAAPVGPHTDHIGGCTSFTPHALADPSGLLNGWAPQRTLELALAADYRYASPLRPNWAAQATAVINGVDGVYEQIGVDVAIVDIHAHLRAEIDATTTGAALTQLKAHYKVAHAGLAREAVGLFSGRNFSNALGQANCIGGAGDPELAYYVGQSLNFDPLTLAGQITIYSNSYVKIHAHELGHLFNAHHHYGNCHEAHHEAGQADVCTLMAPYVDLLDETFGSLERLVTRGWADAENL